LVTEGWSDHEIARALDLNASTLKKSLLGIYEKLGVSNRVELLFCVLSLCADSRIRL
jgi:DNA-binding NarL/FixJ family response regulator